MKSNLVKCAGLSVAILLGVWLFSWTGRDGGGGAPVEQAAPVAPALPDSPAPPPSRQRPETSVPARAAEAPTPVPAPARILRFAPASGQVVSLRFQLQSEGEVDLDFVLAQAFGREAPEAGSTAIRAEAEGDVTLKYFAAAEGGWDVAAVVSRFRYSINDETPLYAEAVAYPFGFRMTDTGYLSRFQFARELPAEAGQFLEGLLYRMQIAFPKEAKEQWRTREVDPTGTYRSEYALWEIDSAHQTAQLTKEKVEYLSTAAAGLLGGARNGVARTRVEEGGTDATVPLSGPWIAALTQRERVVSLAGDREWARHTTEFSVWRVDAVDPDALPATFTALLAQLETDRFLKSRYYATDPQLNALGAGLGTAQALELYKRLAASDRRSERELSESFVVNYLRQHPQAAFELVEILNAGNAHGLDPSTQLVLWRLLTKAGHREAQRAVVDAVVSPRHTALTRVRALAYVHDFENPEPFMVDELMRLHVALGEPADQTAQELKAMSLYAVGTLGSREKKNAAVREEVARRLSDNLIASTDPGERITTLAAIGNHGGEELLPAIEPLFLDAEPDVRRAAYDALRQMDSPAAVETLVRHYDRERSVAVRAGALKTLARMPVSAEGVGFARQEVGHVDDPRAQVALVDLLGSSLDDYPENEDVLRELLEQGVAREVKRAVYRYIEPR